VGGRLERAYARLLEHGELRVDRTTLDDTLVITRWLEQNEEHPAVHPYSEAEPWDWNAVARDALQLTYQEFVDWQPVDEPEDIVLDVTVAEESEAAFLAVEPSAWIAHLGEEGHGANATS
jgi:hypothetical protein